MVKYMRPFERRVSPRCPSRRQLHVFGREVLVGTAGGVAIVVEGPEEHHRHPLGLGLLAGAFVFAFLVLRPASVPGNSVVDRLGQVKKTLKSSG